jgi:hypothetical protein
MTKKELQDIVLMGLQEKITDSFTLRESISMAFAAWFQALAVPPPPPQMTPAPGAEGAAPPPPPPEEGAPPNGA